MLDLKNNPVVEFTALDRCDRCGAQAYSLAKKDGHAELLFCMHHRKVNRDALINDGWTIVDDSAGIENLVDVNF